MKIASRICEVDGYQRLLIARAPAELKRELERLSKRRIALELTDHRQMILRAIPEGDGRLRVRAHHMFLFAPEAILAFVARYIANPLDRSASEVVDFFIAGEGERIRRGHKGGRLKTRGRFYDLAEIFERLEGQYFEGEELGARITWGRAKARRSRSILFGSHTPGGDGQAGLIRINPALDQSFVPADFVDFVVYHEMLHAVIPVRVVGGRRVVHPPEFRQRERRFERYAFAVRWEQRHLGRFFHQA